MHRLGQQTVGRAARYLDQELHDLRLGQRPGLGVEVGQRRQLLRDSGEVERSVQRHDHSAAATSFGSLANIGITSLANNFRLAITSACGTTSLALRMKLMQSTPNESHFLTARMMRAGSP